MKKAQYVEVVALALIIIGCLSFISKIYVNGTRQIAAISGADSGLVAYYTFDEGSGTMAGDSSGNGNPGTLTGNPAWAAGKVGSGSLSFSEGNKYVTIPDSSSLSSLAGSNQASIAFWINKTPSTAVNGIMNRMNPGKLFAFYSDANFSIRTEWRYGGSGTGGSTLSALCSNSTCPMPSGEWHHVALIYNNPTSYIYVDGQLKAQSSGTGGPLNTGVTGPWEIGRYSSLYSNASLDDVRIYNKALTAQDISDLYALGGGTPPATEPPPVTNPPPSTNPPPTTTGPGTYYVSVNGNDAADGSQSTPWKTIQKCANTLQAGSTCLVSAGTYPEHVVTKFGGTSDTNRIIFKADKTNGPVIMQGFQVLHPYVTMDGFDMTGYTSGFSGHITLEKGGDYCQIVNNTIRDGAANVFGIKFNLAGDLTTANNCVIRGNTLRNLNYTFLSIAGVSHTIENNVFEHLNSRDYVYVFGHGHVFRGNIFKDGNIVVGVGNHPDWVQTFGDTGLDSYDMLFENNWIENLDGDTQLGELDAGASSRGGIVFNIHDWTFRNNVIISVGSNMNTSMPGLRFEHNTFYRLAYNLSGINITSSLTRGDASRNVFINNAFVGGGNAPTLDKDSKGFYNLSGALLMTEVLTFFAKVDENTALAINFDLTANGYLQNPNGRLTAKARALTDISQFTITSPYTYNGVAYDVGQYKSTIYDLLLKTAQLENSIRSSFVADYNFVAGAGPTYYSKANVCSDGIFTQFNFCETQHGTTKLNGGNPMFKNEADPDGPDNIPFTLDDGLKPLPGSPLCGAGASGTDIGVYSCDPSQVLATGGSVVMPPPPSGTNGSCGAVINTCTVGSFSDTTDTSTDNLWQCTGSNGGTTAQCSLPKAVATPDPSLPCEIGPKTIRAYPIADGTSIRLIWPKNDFRQELRISRRVYSNRPSSWQNWTEIYSVTDPTLASQASEYRDTNVSSGVHYEYQISSMITNWSCSGTPVLGTWSNFWDYQYIDTGTNVPLKDQRGKLVLLVESGIASSLSTELTRLQNDLIGDGYKVYRHDVAAADVGTSNWKAGVASTKALIRADYNTDPSTDWTIFIVGHIPIPYSGLNSPGSHTDNFGANPADWYYADMDENVWTDTTANDTTSSYTSNYNTPGDGKFDQSYTPSAPEMRIGRIDLRNMPSFGKTEVQLLKQYLDREHAWRTKQFTARNRALVNSNNNAGLIYTGRPYESHDVYSSFFGGPANTDLGAWLTSASTPSSSYLFAASSGNGHLTEDLQIGTTANFAANPLYVVFPSMHGSYYGDWDSSAHPDIVIQAPLAAEGYAVANYYRENVMNLDSSSMGEPISQELFTLASDIYVPSAKFYYSYGWMYNGQKNLMSARVNNYVTLLGDPTLRTRIVAPPTNVGVSVQGSDNLIAWTEASDSNVQGYYVYRAPANDVNSFVRLTNTPIVGSYRDAGAASGSYKYMVRTVKLESTLNRSYYNASVGIFAGSAVFTAKPGDFNNDGTVNSVDFSMFQSAYNTSNTSYDLNKDGVVNTLDYAIMSRNWG